MTGSLFQFLRRKAAAPPPEPPTPARPTPPADLHAAGFSDAEIVRYAITYPFADVPYGGITYHEQGRAALERILSRVTE